MAGHRVEGHAPRKRFGQHFLHDRQVIDRIASAACAGNPCNVVEIGPGLGALTGALLERVERLTVVELDRDLAAKLARENDPEHLRVHQMDILNCDIGALPRACPGEPVRVVGNLPYNISTPLIFHLLSHISEIDSMVFMVQKEVARRLTATPGSKAYGRLTVMTSLDLTTETLFDVAPGSFTPPPRVDSSVIRMAPKRDIASRVDRKLLATLVTAAFSRRRKTLRNNLSTLLTPSQFEMAGVDPAKRAEELDVPSFVRLARALAPDS